MFADGRHVMTKVKEVYTSKEEDEEQQQGTEQGQEEKKRVKTSIISSNKNNINRKWSSTVTYNSHL